MKAEPKGNLHVTPDIAAGLNLKDLKPHQAQAAAALWMLQPVSPWEQALILLGIPLVQRSRKVHSISSRPPQQRTYTVSKSKTVCRSSIDKYTCRPEALEEVTFYEWVLMFDCIKLNWWSVIWKSHHNAIRHILTTISVVFKLPIWIFHLTTTTLIDRYFRLYEIEDTEKKKTSQEDWPSRLIGKTSIGEWVYKRTERALVRFSDFSPNSNPEGYFYNVLLQQVTCFKVIGSIHFL